MMGNENIDLVGFMTICMGIIIASPILLYYTPFWDLLDKTVMYVFGVMASISGIYLGYKIQKIDEDE